MPDPWADSDNMPFIREGLILRDALRDAASHGTLMTAFSALELDDLRLVVLSWLVTEERPTAG